MRPLPRLFLAVVLLLSGLLFAAGLLGLVGERLSVHAASTVGSSARVSAAVIPSDPVPAGPGSSDAKLDHFVVAAPVVRGALAVFPVVDTRKELELEVDVLTLAEAIEAGSLQVREVEEGQVPTLEVRNTGTQHVLLQAGEVVAGGRQDRVLVQDTLVPPGGEPLQVAVNCVEASRWSAGDQGLSFGYGGRGELALKRAVQHESDQQKTWSTVATLNAAKAARVDGSSEELAPSTGTYMASVKSEAVDRRLDAVAAAIAEGLRRDPDTVGYVAAYNGEVLGAELFGGAALFASNVDAIADSLGMEAVSRGEPDEAQPPPSRAEATDFLRAALHGEHDRAEAAPAATVRAQSSDDLALTHSLSTASGELLKLSAFGSSAAQPEAPVVQEDTTRGLHEQRQQRARTVE